MAPVLLAAPATPALGQTLAGRAVDDVRGTPVSGAPKDIEAIAAMAILVPTEATFLFGVRGEAGAVLVWTRRGVR